jgi:hypothetical protein
LLLYLCHAKESPYLLHISDLILKLYLYIRIISLTTVKRVPDLARAMEKEFDTPHPSSVTTNNKALQKKMSIDKPPEFPSEPQYIPWPWRTANRAMKTNTTAVNSATISFKSSTTGIPDLGDCNALLFVVTEDGCGVSNGLSN